MRLFWLDDPQGLAGQKVWVTMSAGDPLWAGNLNVLFLQTDRFLFLLWL